MSNCTKKIAISSTTLRHIHRDHVCAGLKGYGRPRQSVEPWHDVLGDRQLARFRAKRVKGAPVDRQPLKAAIQSGVEQSFGQPLFVEYDRVVFSPRYETGREPVVRCGEYICDTALLACGEAGSEQITLKTAYFPSYSVKLEIAQRKLLVVLKRKKRYSHLLWSKPLFPKKSDVFIFGAGQYSHGSAVSAVEFQNPQSWEKASTSGLSTMPIAKPHKRSKTRSS